MINCSLDNNDFIGRTPVYFDKHGCDSDVLRIKTVSLSKIFIFGLLAVFLVVICEPAFALRESRLWLPKKYTYLMPRLISAAYTAESSDDCVEVVDAQLDVGRSTEELPLFRIICRNAEGKTYIVRLSGEPVSEATRQQAAKDTEKANSVGVSVKQWQHSQGSSRTDSAKGISKSVEELEEDDPIDIDSILRDLEKGDEVDKMKELNGFEGIFEGIEGIEIVDEEEDQIAESETPKIIEPIETEKGWSICLNAVEKKTVNMLNIKLHAEPRPQAEFTAAGETIYPVNFEAANALGAMLNYRASCKVLSSGIVRVTIGTRKQEAKTAETLPHKVSAEKDSQVQALPVLKEKDEEKGEEKEIVVPVSGHAPVESPPVKSVSEQSDTNTTEDGWSVIEE